MIPKITHKATPHPSEPPLVSLDLSGSLPLFKILIRHIILHKTDCLISQSKISTIATTNIPLLVSPINLIFENIYCTAIALLSGVLALQATKFNKGCMGD